MTAISNGTQNTLERIALGEIDLLETSIGLREVSREKARILG